MHKDGSRIREILLRARWSAADAQTIFSAWEESKLPATEFAGKHGFDVQRLYWWRRRLGKGDPPGETGPAFEEVVVGAERSVEKDGADFEIRCPDGLAIRVRSGFDEHTLKRLLRIVREDGAC